MTLVTALLLPAFIGTAGLGVEASNWGALSSEMQRGADLAALTAGLIYHGSANAQTAANAAADVAELNGLAAGQRTWDASTNTLTEGRVTIQSVPGIRSASDTGFMVSVQKPVPLVLAKLFLARSSVPVSAHSWSELVLAASPQPCVVGLSTSATAVSLGGGGAVNAPNCAVRSNGGVSVVGASSLAVLETDAGGAIGGGGSISGATHANDGTIPDPYSSNTAVQNAFAALSAGSGTALAISGGSQTVSPGTYSSITISGSSTAVTFQPGLYTVNGNIAISGGTLSAAGATIVSSGTFAVSGQASITWAAPGTLPVGGAIPGIVYAGKTSGAVSLAGGGTLMVTGVIYAPGAALSVAGNATYGSAACLELIGGTVTITGTSSLGEKCSTLGALGFGSTTATTVALVQ